MERKAIQIVAYPIEAGAAPQEPMGPQDLRTGCRQFPKASATSGTPTRDPQVREELMRDPPNDR
jgi:hypothetical protein